MPKPLTFAVWITANCGKFFKRWEYQTTWPASCETCMQVKKQQLEPDMEQQTGFKLGKEYIRAVYCHPAGSTYMSELPYVRAGFRKGRGTRDQIANICWIIEQAREFQKKHLLYWLRRSLWLCGSQQTVENSSRDGNTRSPDLPPVKPVCRSRSNN